MEQMESSASKWHKLMWRKILWRKFVVLILLLLHHCNTKYYLVGRVVFLVFPHVHSEYAECNSIMHSIFLLYILPAAPLAADAALGITAILWWPWSTPALPVYWLPPVFWPSTSFLQ